MTSLALLLLRLVVGGLLAGHGAQKLFGWSEGPGPEGTTAYMASLDITPPKQWALAAGTSEFVGGAMTALGLLNPIGPIIAMGAMTTAWLTQHKNKPIWITKGGAELPATNLAALGTLVLAGPGALSLDAAFGTRVRWWFSFLALSAVGVGIASATAGQPIALPAPKARRVGGPVPFEAEAPENAETTA